MIDPTAAPIAGYVLDGPRRGRALSGEPLGEALEGAELAWAHIPLGADDWGSADQWLAAHVPGLDATTRQALLGETTRPRALAAGRGLMIVLRGINLNAGEDLEDMVSCRVYMDERRIVTLSRKPLRSIAALSVQMAEGKGPETAAAFLHDLAEALIDRIEETLETLESEVDALEEMVDRQGLSRDEANAARARAARLRRLTLSMRRHIAPQRDAIGMAGTQAPSLIPEADRRRLAEVQDRHQRAVEELDEAAGLLTLVRDEIRAEQDERTNRNLYVLSVLSALFLPLGFLTGLLGVNLGGIPGTEDPWGFALFCGILGAVFVVQVVVLLRLRRL